MSAYLNLKPEFPIRVDDLQEIAMRRLGRYLNQQEIASVQHGVSGELYEVHQRLVDRYVRRWLRE